MHGCKERMVNAHVVGASGESCRRGGVRDCRGCIRGYVCGQAHELDHSPIFYVGPVHEEFFLGANSDNTPAEFEHREFVLLEGFVHVYHT